MAWNWMVGESEWIIPSPNVHIPPHQESTWAVQLITVVEVAEAVVAAGGAETRIMIVVMTGVTDMMSMITGTVAGALHHLTTVDTGLAHGLAPTAHGDTKLSLSPLGLSFPPVTDSVGFIPVFCWTF